MPGDSIKVLYCSFAVLPEPSGLSVRASEWVRALTDCFEVDGLTVKTPELSHIERFLGMRLMRVPVGTGDLLVRAQAFERAVRRQLASDEYQAVHFTDPFAGYSLCEARAQQGFKLLYEVNGLPSFELRYTHPHLTNDSRFMAKLRRQELFCLMNADVVLVGSAVTAGLLQSLGVPRERLAYLPTGAAPPSSPAPLDGGPEAGPAGASREAGGPLRVLYLGNQMPWQGLSTLLSAAALASARCELSLTLAGPQHPSFRLPLEEQVSREKLAGRVTLREVATDEALAEVLAASDVGVAPLEATERNEQQGAPVAKIASYLAAGRPLVASDLPMVREVSDPGCALYHRPGDAAELAARLVELAEEPARRAAMGRKAAAFAKERFDRERLRLGLLRLYRTQLGLVSATPPEGGPGGPSRDETHDEPTHLRHGPLDSTGSTRPPDDPTVTLDLDSLDRPTDPWARRPAALAEEATPAARPPFPPLPKRPEAEATPPAGNTKEGSDRLPPPDRSTPLPSRPARAGALPGPVEVDSEDVVELIAPPLLKPTPCPARRTPGSGTSPAEEWLGHVLFGYAPFELPLR